MYRSKYTSGNLSIEFLTDSLEDEVMGSREPSNVEIDCIKINDEEVDFSEWPDSIIKAIIKLNFNTDFEFCG